MNSRNTVIDIYKGILILCVVLGHLGIPYGVLVYRFHMPLFFVLSGYLLNITKIKSVSSYAWKRTKQLLIPYFLYFLLVYALYQIIGRTDFMDEFRRILYSGKMVDGVYGNWWFTTVLLVSQIGVVQLCKAIKGNKKRIVLYFIFCILGVIYSNIAWKYDSPIAERMRGLPWNLDVVCIALPYVGMGHALRSIQHDQIKPS